MAQFLWEHESNGKDWLQAMLYRNNQQRLYLCLCTSVHSTEMWCVTFLASLLMLIDSFSYKEFIVLAHSTFTSSNSLTRKVWYYQPITSNGNKRSSLNYSFGMSNNACRLLFRVRETHMNNSSAGFAFLRRVALWFRCLWESYLRAGGLCHSWADLGCHCSSNMGGTEGGRDACSSRICRPPPHCESE